MSQSRKHAPRVDEELERQAEGHTRGAPPGSRAEEWRESETPMEGEPEVTAAPQGDSLPRSDFPIHLTPYELEERSRFSRFLNRSTFPADRKELIRAARDSGAPDDVMDNLRRLPSGETFENAARAWAALDHKMDRRF
jgi:hypothetical protein